MQSGYRWTKFSSQSYKLPYVGLVKLYPRIVTTLLWVAFIALPSPSIHAGVGKLVKKAEREIGPGVRYVNYVSRGRRSVNVHAVYYDLATSGTALRVVKAGNHNTGRLPLVGLAQSYETQTYNTVLAMVNANFWSAGRNTPIGPCVVDGEVVEMVPYKHWSSAFIDFTGAVVIDTFRLGGQATIGGNVFPIESCNRRLSDSSFVLYNGFAGSAVPSVSEARLTALYTEWMRDSAFLQSDSTEVGIDSAQVRAAIERAQIEANVEHGLRKISLDYIGKPSINKPLSCVVRSIDTGEVSIPDNGCILSVPKHVSTLPCAVGDTVSISFTTNVHTNKRFMNAVCGTPRLVRNGKAKPEAQQEGVTGKRFIRRKLARTCLGVTKDGKKLILAAIEPTVASKRQLGATLLETAQVMRSLGAYQAMNLDGGGSTGMVIGTDHVFFEGVDPQTRPVSVGLGVVKIGHVLSQPTH